MIYRIFKSDSGLTDLSSTLEDFNDVTEAFSLTSSGKLYIGSPWPIVDLYFNVTTGSADGRSTTVKYWDGNQFRAVADLIDDTKSGANTFGKAGHLSWIPDRDHGQSRVTDADQDITELAGVKLYNKYWYEISFSDAISFSAGWIGSLFCAHSDIDSEYPDLVRSDVMDAVESGKTDYLKQIVRASELVIDDCINQGKFQNEGQVLDRRELKLPTVSKVAEIVYSLLDQDQGAPRMNMARAEYLKRIAKILRQVDLDGNGIMSSRESRPQYKVLTR